MRIRDYLKENIGQRLRIATPTLYRSYEEYIGRFIKKGGIIEAKPPVENRCKLTFPCISFCVEPNGEYNIVTTYEKVMGSPFRSYACSFPQKSVEMSKVDSTIRQICDSFKMRKIFGHFTIDLLCYQNEKQTQQKIWVLDIDPFMNDYTCSFYLFDILMRGSYFPEKNIYLAENEAEDKLSVYSGNTLTSDANS